MTRRTRAADRSAEKALRPDTWDAIIGQKPAVDVLRRMTDAALERGDMPGHTLLMGPPGTGKTTFAGAMAHELGAELTVLFGPNLRSFKPLADALSGMSAVAAARSRTRYVVMVDEIHRMYGPVQESLYTVMEDRVLRYDDGSKLDLAPLTVIGATTDPDRLLEPMITRFPAKVRLTLYAVDELAEIAIRAARTLGYALLPDAAEEVGRRSSGTPRIAISIVRVLRDYTHADRGMTLGHGMPWADNADVGILMAEPSLVWNLEGRDASGRHGPLPKADPRLFDTIEGQPPRQRE